MDSQASFLEKMSILSHYKVEINYHIYKAGRQHHPPTKDRPRTWTDDKNMPPYTNKKMKTNPHCKFKHNKKDNTITCHECKFSSSIEIYLCYESLFITDLEECSGRNALLCPVLLAQLFYSTYIYIPSYWSRYHWCHLTQLAFLHHCTNLLWRKQWQHKPMKEFCFKPPSTTLSHQKLFNLISRKSKYNFPSKEIVNWL